MFASVITALSFAALLPSALAATGKTIVVTVGGNTTADPGAVFSPQQVTGLAVGDTVIFNFTTGNHSATQALFAQPCIPAHEANVTVNGFDSGIRNTVNGTAITILAVPILEENVNTTFWFYDINTCGEGGVGVINPNDTTLETLDGFTRNAIRLNGTGADSTSSSSSSHKSSATSASASATASSSSSGAERTAIFGGLAAVPLMFLALLSL